MDLRIRISMSKCDIPASELLKCVVWAWTPGPSGCWYTASSHIDWAMFEPPIETCLYTKLNAECKVRADMIAEDLANYFYHPNRVRRWIEAGNDVEPYDLNYIQ